jgi:hypothetical protein
MMYGNEWMFGMHFLWWCFWIAITVVVAALLLRRPVERTGTSQLTPIQILAGCGKMGCFRVFELTL